MPQNLYCFLNCKIYCNSNNSLFLLSCKLLSGVDCSTFCLYYHVNCCWVWSVQLFSLYAMYAIDSLWLFFLLYTCRFICNLNIFPMISLKYIVSINKLTNWYRKLTISVTWKTHYNITDKNNNIIFESLHTLSLVPQLILWTHCYSGDNVCLDLQNCCYSIFVTKGTVGHFGFYTWCKFDICNLFIWKCKN